MSDKQYLSRAVAISKNSLELVGCGAIIVRGNSVIAEEYNSQNSDNITVNHAEIKAITAANKKLGKRKLNDCIAYCSCEPCAMCLIAFAYANIPRIVFNKTMKDLFPEDPQSKMNPYDFLKQLNFSPKLEHLTLS